MNLAYFRIEVCILARSKEINNDFEYLQNNKFLYQDLYSISVIYADFLLKISTITLSLYSVKKSITLASNFFGYPFPEISRYN